jgi:hypothetical protein
MGTRRAIGAGATACLMALTSCATNSGREPSAPSSALSTSPGTSVVSGTGGSVQRLDCTDNIGAHRPEPGVQVVLGVVALPTSTAGPALQTFRTVEAPSLPRLYGKWGLLVRAGADFQLMVPPGSKDRFGIGWGSSASPGTAVRVNHCRQVGLSDRWIAFAGGYWLDHPACVALLVRTTQKTKTVHIGLGTPCPGQRRPPQPNQS